MDILSRGRVILWNLSTIRELSKDQRKWKSRLILLGLFDNREKNREVLFDRHAKFLDNILENSSSSSSSSFLGFFFQRYYFIHSS